MNQTRRTCLALALAAALPTLGMADQPPREPYSCGLFADEQRKCAFGRCDPRAFDRLKRECLREGR